MQQLPGQTPGFGVSDGAIKGRGALPLKLSGGVARVRLTLSPLNAALFVKKGVILSTHWAGEEAMQETVVADADQLWLLNAGAGEAYYSVEIVPGGGEQAGQPVCGQNGC